MGTWQNPQEPLTVYPNTIGDLYKVQQKIYLSMSEHQKNYLGPGSETYQNCYISFRTFRIHQLSGTCIKFQTSNKPIDK